jgi:hypothetical protein
MITVLLLLNFVRTIVDCKKPTLVRMNGYPLIPESLHYLAYVLIRFPLLIKVLQQALVERSIDPKPILFIKANYY